jgi:small subunit ribosomal protein S17
MADENPQDQEATPTLAANADAEAEAEADAGVVEAAHDADRALEAVEAEAASELPASDSAAAVVQPQPPSASAPASTPEPESDGPRLNRRKVREGIVVSDGMQATVVVAVVERVRHPRYGKTVQRTKRLYVHDAEDTAKVGDRVRVQETRPMSKLKRWRLTEVVERAR